MDLFDFVAKQSWPEGNAWLARQMRQRFNERIETAALVHRIAEFRRHVEVDIYLAREDRTVRWRANRVIFAAPGFAPCHGSVCGIRPRQ